MTSVQLEVQLSPEQLLKAVKQMPPPELEWFAEQVMALRPRPERGLSQAESELLLKINQGVPADLQRRYDELIAKRDAATLTEDEYKELLELTNQVEMLDARRVELLIELAHIRQKPLRLLMQELGIQRPVHA